MERDRDFTLTDDHIKLLRRANVDYDEWTEYGAPRIDPKRPYGNSDVERDIADILGWTMLGRELTDEQAERANELHRQTAQALQAVLRDLPSARYWGIEAR